MNLVRTSSDMSDRGTASTAACAASITSSANTRGNGPCGAVTRPHPVDSHGRLGLAQEFEEPRRHPSPISRQQYMTDQLERSPGREDHNLSLTLRELNLTPRQTQLLHLDQRLSQLTQHSPPRKSSRASRSAPSTSNRAPSTRAALSSRPASAWSAATGSVIGSASGFQIASSSAVASASARRRSAARLACGDAPP
jgi:hypothetical protein